MNKNINVYKELQYGMMIHWGLYSVLAGEYDGKYSSNYAEWIQSYHSIPIKEYEKLAAAFNPIYFDAERIVKFAKESGMKYIVFTTKHHDGFAMYKSKADSFNICDATPFGRDVLAELAEACKKHDIKLGIYYSQDLDWHEPDGGGYLANPDECCGTTWDNSWDFKGEKDFSRCFEKKILPQIEEIMSNYGEIFLAWFDVPMTINAEQSKKIYETVKRLQPDCLINSRLGNGKYDYVSFGDNEIPDELNAVADEEIDYQNICGIKPSPYGLYETAATINDTWGFSYNDHNWKSAKEIYNTKKKLKSLGANYLLNVGPDGLGRIPVASMEILKEVAKMDNENN